MLSLNRKTDYALVALTYLGQRHHEGRLPVSARQVAEQFNLSTALVMNILKELGRAGIVQSTRGAGGGYELAVDPADVSLMDVIAAIEGPIQIARCAPTGANDEGEGCELECNCPIREPIRRLHTRIQTFLEQVTLAELLDTQVDVLLAQVGTA